MDSIQKRTEAQIEQIAERHGYTVSRDASYANVGTFRFHDGDSIEVMHKVFYDFQRGYASFMIDGEIRQTFGYEPEGVNGRTISQFLAVLEDELTSPETLEVTAGREDTGVFAGSLAGSSTGEIAGKNAGLREALAQQESLAETLAARAVESGDLPSADEIEAAGWAMNSPTFTGTGPGHSVTHDDLDRYVEAKAAFLERLTRFIDAGNALVAAWDVDGFNADESYPLPERLAPPLSFDEWFAELSEHYARIEA